MKRRITFMIAELGALALAAGAALAQGGAAIDWWAVAGGGAPAAGGEIALDDTLGQPIVGPSSGDGGVALGAGYWYGGSEPTAVELAWFTATPRDGAIALAWETASEIDLLGFHLYRAEALDAPRTRLNSALIPGQAPGSPAGASYQFVDGAVSPGTTYWYWLAAVDMRGGATLHGPVSAVVGEEEHTVYLPLVSK